MYKTCILHICICQALPSLSYDDACQIWINFAMFLINTATYAINRFIGCSWYFCRKPKLDQIIETEEHLLISISWAILSPDNGFSPVRHQAIIRTNAGVWSMRIVGTDFRVFWIKQVTSILSIKMWFWSVASWVATFCLGLKVPGLITSYPLHVTMTDMYKLQNGISYQCPVVVGLANSEFHWLISLIEISKVSHRYPGFKTRSPHIDILDSNPAHNLTGVTTAELRRRLSKMNRFLHVACLTLAYFTCVETATYTKVDWSGCS